MATPIPLNHACFSLNALLRATRGGLRGPVLDSALEVRGVSTDSRSVGPGELFVALHGERFDGHDHLEAVAARGAVIALVERDVRVPGLTVLVVESTLEALGRLAAHHLERWRRSGKKKVVALTGSAGKTTTKRAIAALLGAQAPGKVLVTAGNLNNLVGVPMTILSVTDATDILVLEMGTNAPGEIAALAHMARPDVGLVTLIASAHSEGLGGLEGIAKEKTAMFRELAPGATAIGNTDDPRVSLGLAASRAGERIAYGMGPEADYRIVRREALGIACQLLEVRRPDGSVVVFSTPLLGEAGALATVAGLAAAACASPGNPDTREVIEAALGVLSSLEEGPGRLQARELQSGIVVLDDSYNANPASCRASIDTARELAAALGRPLVLVLGEMRELGADRESAHRSLGEWAADSGARLLITVGPEAERTAARASERGQATRHADTSARAAVVATEVVESKDFVLVKGSRGVRTELVIDALAALAAVAPSGLHGAPPSGASA